jgi:hypothetical protein
VLDLLILGHPERILGASVTVLNVSHQKTVTSYSSTTETISVSMIPSPVKE